MAVVQGNYDSKFAKVAEAAGEMLDNGEDLGSSVTVLLEGRPVVDIWGGFAEEGRPWERDTITNVWSTTKTMTALCLLILIDRGHVDPDAPVATYWPEFAANGKDGVLVWHLMSHASGVSGWAQPVTMSDLYDWEKSTGMLAAQAPWWEPGTAMGYHALNYGHLIGEVVRRVTGRSLGRFFADEVAGPLGADFHIGLPESEFARIAPVIPPPPLPLPEGTDPESIVMKTFGGPPAQAEASWTTPWRTAEIGAANGHGNARSVARAQAVIANGGEVDGVRLLSKDTLDLVFEERIAGIDQVLGVDLRFGLGYCLQADAQPYIPTGRVGFWGGWGGSAIINDADRNLTISYMMNKMSGGLVGSRATEAIVTAVYAALG
ncbi:EstA family serine hydrolase [Nocardioides insulae]|uniref:EstA family serine hydrolase n=1 Tax=Nocardioides insulae TaxID=394734 RepID=UPI00048ED84E|nr:EstA family serine hydrolase [Nocardioides insulae]